MQSSIQFQRIKKIFFNAQPKISYYNLQPSLRVRGMIQMLILKVFISENKKNIFIMEWIAPIS